MYIPTEISNVIGDEEKNIILYLYFTNTKIRQEKKKCSRHLYTCLETFDSLIMLFHYTNFCFFLSLLVQHNTFCQFWKVRRREFLVKVKVFLWCVCLKCNTLLFNVVLNETTQEQRQESNRKYNKSCNNYGMLQTLFYIVFRVMI